MTAYHPRCAPHPRPQPIATQTGARVEPPRRHDLSFERPWLAAAGAVAAVVIAAALFTRFGIEEELRRDEAIYAYAGQQLADGVPPYVSILDPKTPLASFLSGGAVSLGRAAGIDDLTAIRLAFFVIAVLAVLAVYAVGRLLFRSTAAGLAAAIVLAAFEGFAIDALGGPNAKTPGVLFATLTIALLVARGWFWAGLAAALALLVWQPLAMFVLVAVVGAWVGSDPSSRWRNAARAAVGAAIPGALTLAYFQLAGALPELVEGGLLLPLTGTERGSVPFLEHVQHIVRSVSSGYGPSAPMLWIGLAVLLGLIVARVVRLRTSGCPAGEDPLIAFVAPPLAFFAAFSLIDFQGYPDAYPLLPLAALGIGGGTAAVLRRAAASGWREPARVAAVALGAALVTVSWWWYSGPRPQADALTRQRSDVERAESLLLPGETVMSLGTPAPLVLMGRTNPNRMIYLSAGVDRWIVEHLPGGFDGWIAQIAADDPDMVIIGGWSGDFAGPMRAWLRDHYVQLAIGELRVYVTSAIHDRGLDA